MEELQHQMVTHVSVFAHNFTLEQTVRHLSMYAPAIHARMVEHVYQTVDYHLTHAHAHVDTQEPTVKLIQAHVRTILV